MRFQSKWFQCALALSLVFGLSACAGSKIDQFFDKPYFDTPPGQITRADKELFERALFRQKNNRNQAAIKVWNDFLRKHPNSFEAHNNLGLVYFENDQLDDAIAEFEKAHSLEPSDSRIRKNLIQVLKFKATLLEESKDYNGAVNYLIRAQALSEPREQEKISFQIEEMQDKVYEQVKRIGTLEAYESFLKRFPNSPKNSDEARMKIEELKARDRMAAKSPEQELEEHAFVSSPDAGGREEDLFEEPPPFPGSPDIEQVEKEKMMSEQEPAKEAPEKARESSEEITEKMKSMAGAMEEQKTGFQEEMGKKASVPQFPEMEKSSEDLAMTKEDHSEGSSAKANEMERVEPMEKMDSAKKEMLDQIDATAELETTDSFTDEKKAMDSAMAMKETSKSMKPETSPETEKPLDSASLMEELEKLQAQVEESTPPPVPSPPKMSSMEKSMAEPETPRETPEPEISMNREKTSSKPVLPEQPREVIPSRNQQIEIASHPNPKPPTAGGLQINESESDSMTKLSSTETANHLRMMVRIATKRDPLRVRDAPSLESRVISAVPKGAVVPVIREENGWYKVEYSQGKMGWIAKKYVQALE